MLRIYNINCEPTELHGELIKTMCEFKDSKTYQYYVQTINANIKFKTNKYIKESSYYNIIPTSLTNTRTLSNMYVWWWRYYYFFLNAFVIKLYYFILVTISFFINFLYLPEVGHQFYILDIKSKDRS